MIAGLTIEEFWECTEEETLRYINAHHRRMEQWDDLLAHHAMQTLAPHFKKGRRPRLKQFKFYSSQDSGDEFQDEADVIDIAEAWKRREKLWKQVKQQGAPASILKRHGKDVPVQALD